MTQQSNNVFHRNVVPQLLNVFVGHVHTLNHITGLVNDCYICHYVEITTDHRSFTGRTAVPKKCNSSTVNFTKGQPIQKLVR